MRIAIVGSRGWTDDAAIQRYIDSLPASSVIVSGGASGVDSMAERHARARGLEVVVFKPDYQNVIDKRKAPLLRNTTIVENADVVVAFWDGRSTGTLDTIKKALAAKNVQRVTVVKG